MEYVHIFLYSKINILAVNQLMFLYLTYLYYIFKDLYKTKHISKHIILLLKDIFLVVSVCVSSQKNKSGTLTTV